MRMATIFTSRIAPVVAKIRFRGVLEAAYAMRFLLRQLSNAEIRREMAILFGERFNRLNQERCYFDFLHSYVQHHHGADYFRYLWQHNIVMKKADKKQMRSVLIRYAITQHGLHGNSEIVNDL